MEASPNEEIGGVIKGLVCEPCPLSLAFEPGDHISTTFQQVYHIGLHDEISFKPGSLRAGYLGGCSTCTEP